MKRLGLFVWMIFGFVVGGYLFAAGALEGLKNIVALGVAIFSFPLSRVNWAYPLGEVLGCAILILIGYELVWVAAPKAHKKLKIMKAVHHLEGPSELPEKSS